MKKLILLMLSLATITSSFAQLNVSAITKYGNNNTVICEIMITANPNTRLGSGDFYFSYSNKLSNPTQTGVIAGGDITIKSTSIIINTQPFGSASPLITATPTLLASFTFNNLNYNAIDFRDFTCSSQNAFLVNTSNNNQEQAASVSCSSAFASALPIELIRFHAQNTSEGNLLTWQTASEINASHFDIERSDDGKKFEKIGEVKAQGKAANYEYIDKQAQVATVYYRLKNTDLDETFTYSKIVSISPTQKGMKAKVYPNPFSENINIEIFTDEKQELIIEFLDIVGKKMYTSKINNTEGVNIPVSTKSLPNGTYFLKIFDGKQIIQEKIIKCF